MELSDIRTAVRNSYGIAVTDGQAADAVINQFINSALREVTLDRDWDWNELSEDITMVADQSEYARAATARKTVRLVDVSNGRELLQVNPRFAVRYRDQTSTAVYWYVQGGTIFLVPTPARAGDVYEHIYQGSEAVLALDADAPRMPDYAIDLLITKAVMRLAARLGDTKKYNLAQAEHERVKESLVNDARQATGVPRMLSRRDWTRQAGY